MIWISAYPPSPPIGGFGRARRGNDKNNIGNNENYLISIPGFREFLNNY